LSHTHYNNLDFSFIFHLFFKGQNPRISMGPSADHPFPYPPPCDRWL
jgi:hypothetical protein